jgi:hypothetical protein
MLNSVIWSGGGFIAGGVSLYAYAKVTGQTIKWRRLHWFPNSVRVEGPVR